MCLVVTYAFSMNLARGTKGHKTKVVAPLHYPPPPPFSGSSEGVAEANSLHKCKPYSAAPGGGEEGITSNTSESLIVSQVRPLCLIFTLT